MFYPPIVGLGIVACVMVAINSVQGRGGLTRNLAIGIRTRHTLASDEAWASGQASARPYATAIALIAVAHMIALLTIQLTAYPEALGHILSVSGYIVIVAVALLAWRAANRASIAASDET